MKRWLIYSAVAAALVMSGCGNKEGEKSQTQTSAPQTEQHAAPAKAAPAAKPEAPKPEAAKEVAPAPTQTPQQKPVAAESVKEQAQAEAKKITETVTETAKKVEENVKQAAAAATGGSQVDAATLFTKCAGCHGMKGEKHALGQSNIIAGQPKAELVKKIEGYQKGTYGGPMKGVMKGQVAGLTPAQIEALADYISKLK